MKPLPGSRDRQRFQRERKRLSCLCRGNTQLTIPVSFRTMRVALSLPLSRTISWCDAVALPSYAISSEAGIPEIGGDVPPLALAISAIVPQNHEGRKTAGYFGENGDAGSRMVERDVLKASAASAAGLIFAEPIRPPRCRRRRLHPP